MKLNVFLSNQTILQSGWFLLWLCSLYFDLIQWEIFYFFQITSVHGTPIFTPDQQTTNQPSQENLQTGSDYNGGDDSDTTAQSVKLPVGDEETSSELYPISSDLVNLDIDRAIRDIECVDSPPNVVSKGEGVGQFSNLENILSSAIWSTFSDKNTIFVFFFLWYSTWVHVILLIGI